MKKMAADKDLVNLSKKHVYPQLISAGPICGSAQQ